MDKKFQTFVGIMVFYIFLSFVVFPLGFYYGIGKTLENAGNGYVVGSLVSLALWLSFGRKMI
jgi:hypothetical protein